MAKLSVLITVALSLSVLAHPTTRGCHRKNRNRLLSSSVSVDIPQATPQNQVTEPNVVNPSITTTIEVGGGATTRPIIPPSTSTPAPEVSQPSPQNNPPSPTEKAPEPTKDSTPPPAQNPPANDGGSWRGTPEDIQLYLDGHNTLRSKYSAPPLTWSTQLASKAQDWADKCVFEHSGAGENLAAGTGGAYGIPQGLKSWADEAPSYNPNNPQASHFTQMVWKATTELGCAYQYCDGIFDPKFGKARYIVCEYAKAGNFGGQYQANVLV